MVVVTAIIAIGTTVAASAVGVALGLSGITGYSQQNTHFESSR